MHPAAVMRPPTIPIPGGDLGILGFTIPRMLQLIRNARALPLVRGVSVRLAAGCHPEDQECREARIYAWVKKRIQFVPDPRRVELLHDPLAVLWTIRRQGWAAGDCDDIAVILASLLESVGIRTRLKVVATSPGPVRPFRHVFVESAQPDGSWRRLDPLGENFPEEAFTRTAVREV